MHNDQAERRPSRQQRDVLSDTVVVARKHHPCDACWLWAQSGYGKADVRPDEWLVIQAAEADGWLILPGQAYRRVVYKDGGKIVTYRGRVGMDALVSRYDLGDE
jgi:flavin-dependent dehydrogenase